MAKTKIVKNTVALYANNIAKMIIPLVTLPYLTRVLSKDCYGTVSYVKAVMQYMQLIVDFGFLLSGTKDIVNCRDNSSKMKQEISDIFAAKLLMAAAAGVALVLLTAAIPLLRKNVVYTALSFVVVCMTCFLFDFVFRGIEEMQVIAVRFVTMKTIAAVLTFVFVKTDADILWIPVLDILGSAVAIVLVFVELHRRKIAIGLPDWKNALKKIRESAVYFVSDVATTAFGALNTLLVGAFLSESDVADWSLCMQMVAAVQAMYSPLTNSIYPEMVRSRDLKIVRKIMRIFMPLVSIGCIFTLAVAPYALLLVGGQQYVSAAPVLRCLTLVLFFSFPVGIFGWPTLGAIGKVKETTKTTVITAVLQIAGLFLLLAFHRFTLVHIALLRGATEGVFVCLRLYYFRRYRNEFSS